MKRMIISVIVFTVTYICACAQEEPLKHYDLKSGIITKETVINEQALETKIYFDDYGNKIATYMSVPYYVGDQLLEYRLFAKFVMDGKFITVDYANKTKTEKDLAEIEFINFLNLGKDVIKRNKIKKKGKEMVCGRPCDIYSFNGGKTMMSVWKGIALKNSVKILNICQDETAVDIQENVDVDPSRFIIPDYPLVDSLIPEK